MRSNNRVDLTGNLGKDPEIRRLENGTVVANVTIATSEKYKNKEGEYVTNTEWHNLVAWRKTAELMERFLKKGHKIRVVGKLTHRSYEDKEGNTKYLTEVVVDEFSFAHWPEDVANTVQAKATAQPATPAQPESEVIPEDDLPF